MRWAFVRENHIWPGMGQIKENFMKDAVVPMVLEVWGEIKTKATLTKKGNSRQ